MLTFEGPKAFVEAVAIGPDNRFVAATGSGAVRVWELADPTADPVEHPAGGPIGFLPDGRLIVAGATVVYADPHAPKRKRAAHALPKGMTATALLPDQRIVCVNRAAVAVCRAEPGGVPVLARIELPAPALRVAVSPDGSWLAAGVAVRGGRAKPPRSALNLFELKDGAPAGGPPARALDPAIGTLNALE